MKLSPLIVALDVENLREAERVISKLGNLVDFYKVGLRLYTRYGPEVLSLLHRKRKKIFLDLKFYDIPNTVAEACYEAVRQKVQMLTVHAGGGLDMMQAAQRAVRRATREFKVAQPFLMGVTVLTSFSSLMEVGIPAAPRQQVLRLATLAVEANLDGVICSPHEIQALRKVVPRRFKIVTPGVRPPGSRADDQRRVKTPGEALALGADAVVMGRPILRAKDPLQVAKQVLAF